MEVEGLKQREANEFAMTERSSLILESTSTASQFDSKVSVEGAGRSRGCCLWIAVVQ